MKQKSKFQKGKARKNQTNKTSFGENKNKKRDQKGNLKGQPKWKHTVAEIEYLEKRISQETPPSGTLYYKFKPKEDESTAPQQQTRQNSRAVIESDDKAKIKIRFSDLPLSKMTQKGLFKSKFVKMTEVQRSSITHALANRDIVCCARTGSGKTLSFLIPVVERLYRLRWTGIDGLGALILVPTRELGIQAFEVLRSFAGLHDMSAALIIGGKDISIESQHIQTMNIIIATPGRLLQHMDETNTFDGSRLHLLVIDEVDLILSMGFKATVDQIMMNLPNSCQKLFFSATIGKDIREMARLNLKKDHEYIQVHDFDQLENRAEGGEIEDEHDKALKSITPTTLLHHYMVVEIGDKLDTLFSFLKSHQKSKCLVFFSARKQVRFAYQAFKTLKVSQNLFELHGKQDQNKRTAIYFQFVEKKQAVLFCTDIAARGIDFPAVDWVIQVDCPEDINTYVHRVGRTARYKSKGNALMFLLPSELAFVESIEKRQLQLKKLVGKADKQVTIKPVLEKLNAENKDLQHLAKRACVSYLRSVHHMGNKAVFDVSKIDAGKLAQSYGLINAPTVQLVQKSSTAMPKEDRIAMLRAAANARKVQKQLAREMEQSDSDDEFFKKKKVDETEGQELVEEQPKDESASEDEEEAATGLPQLSKNRMRKIHADGLYAGKNKIILDKEGKPTTKQESESAYVNSLRLQSEADAKATATEGDAAKHIQTVREALNKRAKEDEQLHKERIKEKRIKLKKRLRQEAGIQDEKDDENQMVLGEPEHSYDEESPSRSSYSEDESDASSSSSSEPELAVNVQKRSKTRETAEERALRLLNKSLFD